MTCPRTRNEILENRRRLRAEYREIFDSVAALLYRRDPIGINFSGDASTDEYEPEAEIILPRLRSCHWSTMCCKLYTQNLFPGLAPTLPVRQSITTKLPQRFGNCGSDVSLKDRGRNDITDWYSLKWWNTHLSLLERSLFSVAKSTTWLFARNSWHMESSGPPQRV